MTSLGLQLRRWLWLPDKAFYAAHLGCGMVFENTVDGRVVPTLSCRLLEASPSRFMATAVKPVLSVMSTILPDASTATKVL
jgi:hypothetical protein